jgi:hypothetical protein
MMSAPMSGLRALLGVICACGAMAGCARADAGSPASRTAPGAPDAAADKAKPDASAPGDTAATQTALKWLAALRQRDRALLVRQSGVPFVVRDASGTGACSSLDVTDPAKLDSIGCLAKDDALHDVLKANPEPDAGPLSPKHLPNWARKWKTEVAAGWNPIGLVVLGKTVSFDLVILVGSDGVHGLFRHTAHDRN